jgi:hypothetical protein
VALDRLRFDRGDRKARLFQRSPERFGLGSRANVEPVDLLAVGTNEAGGEGRVGLGPQMGEDRPVFARDEPLDLELAVADDAQRHRLHPARRARARQLSPQHRRQGEADQIVERAARPVGVDQRLVNLARMAHCLLNRVLGHRVEHHAIDPLVLEQLLALEDFMDVPGDRLALAIGVGREDHAVRVLDRTADVAEALGRFGVDLPAHGEIIVRIDRAILGREIPHMAERGVNAIVLTQILVDGLGLCRRLDDHDFHSGNFLWEPAAHPICPRPFGRGIWRRRGRVSNHAATGATLLKPRSRCPSSRNRRPCKEARRRRPWPERR